MTRTKLKDRKLPNYTRGEEIFNMTSHIVGGGMSILVLFACIILAALHHNIAGIITGAIFGLSSILLYSMSSIYHGLIPEMPKKVMQVFDHCAIYVLIAGTYTPIAICGVAQNHPKLAWFAVIFAWTMAALASVFTAIDLQKYRVFSMICYVGLGWCIVFFTKQIYEAIGTTGIALLFAGGIAYTIGAVLYQIGRKKQYVHGVFHIFVLAGTLLHSICILRLM